MPGLQPNTNSEEKLEESESLSESPEKIGHVDNVFDCGQVKEIQVTFSVRSFLLFDKQINLISVRDIDLLEFFIFCLKKNFSCLSLDQYKWVKLTQLHDSCLQFERFGPY